MAKQIERKSKQMTIRIPNNIWLALRKLQDKGKIESFQDVTIGLYEEYLAIAKKYS